MRALTILPGVPDSARLDDVAEPPVTDGSVLVQTLSIGICGTDREIIAGAYGTAAPGAERLIIGHESLGRVIAAPPGDLQPGDLVVGIVRRPDPVPCPACAAGEWDMCRNGLYTERGIKGRDGYAAERFRIEPEFTVKIDPRLGTCGMLLSPASVVAKAWEQIERICRRIDSWRPQQVLITGAGPIGLLAAMIGCQRGYEVHVYDRAKDGLKPKLTREIGATYHTGSYDGLSPGVVIECTGATEVILDVIALAAPDATVCLAGVSSGGYMMKFDFGKLNRTIVLENNVVFGTVNANRRHYQAAADALAKADPAWLSQIVTRRVPLERWQDALIRGPNDIKVALDFAV